MIPFLIGLVVGGCFGVLIIGILVAGRDER